MSEKEIQIRNLEFTNPIIQQCLQLQRVNFLTWEQTLEILTIALLNENEVLKSESINRFIA